jgi:hypothetical protein
MHLASSWWRRTVEAEAFGSSDELGNISDLQVEQNEASTSPKSTSWSTLPQEIPQPTIEDSLSVMQFQPCDPSSEESVHSAEDIPPVNVIQCANWNQDLTPIESASLLEEDSEEQAQDTSPVVIPAVETPQPHQYEFASLSDCSVFLDESFIKPAEVEEWQPPETNNGFQIDEAVTLNNDFQIDKAAVTLNNGFQIDEVAAPTWDFAPPLADQVISESASQEDFLELPNQTRSSTQSSDESSQEDEEPVVNKPPPAKPGKIHTISFSNTLVEAKPAPASVDIKQPTPGSLEKLRRGVSCLFSPDYDTHRVNVVLNALIVMTSHRMLLTKLPTQAVESRELVSILAGMNVISALLQLLSYHHGGVRSNAAAVLQNITYLNRKCAFWMKFDIIIR